MFGKIEGAGRYGERGEKRGGEGVAEAFLGFAVDLHHGACLHVWTAVDKK